MLSAPDRRQAIGLIGEALRRGARLKRACAELGIAVRTYQRWRGLTPVKADARPGRDVFFQHVSRRIEEQDGVVERVKHKPGGKSEHAEARTDQCQPPLLASHAFIANSATISRKASFDQGRLMVGGTVTNCQPASVRTMRTLSYEGKTQRSKKARQAHNTPVSKKKPGT